MNINANLLLNMYCSGNYQGNVWKIVCPTLIVRYYIYLYNLSIYCPTKASSPPPQNEKNTALSKFAWYSTSWLRRRSEALLWITLLVVYVFAIVKASFSPIVLPIVLCLGHWCNLNGLLGFLEWKFCADEMGCFIGENGMNC